MNLYYPILPHLRTVCLVWNLFLPLSPCCPLVPCCTPENGSSGSCNCRGNVFSTSPIRLGRLSRVSGPRILFLLVKVNMESARTRAGKPCPFDFPSRESSCLWRPFSFASSVRDSHFSSCLCRLRVNLWNPGSLPLADRIFLGWNIQKKLADSF